MVVEERKRLKRKTEPNPLPRRARVCIEKEEKIELDIVNRFSPNTGQLKYLGTNFTYIKKKLLARDGVRRFLHFICVG